MSEVILAWMVGVSEVMLAWMVGMSEVILAWRAWQRIFHMFLDGGHE